jgi:hypothetical protein
MKALKKIVALFLAFSFLFAPQAFASSRIVVEVNGVAVRFSDAEPEIIDGRILVPLRGVFEQMGFTVEWDGSTSTATMRREGTVISVRIGDNFITANNLRIFPDVPPQILGGRFMLPLRAVAEATGDEVAWDAAASTARITTASHFTPIPPTGGTGNAEQTPNPNVPQSTSDEITQWITATTSMIALQNHGTPRLFDLASFSQQCGNCGRALTICAAATLRSSWSVNNANDLRRQINSLLTGGHDMRFWEEYTDLSELVEEFGRPALMSLLSADEAAIISLTLDTGDKWGNRGIIAWDMFRIGTLVSWGHVAGYIDRDEAISLMEPATNVLRLHFSSWQEATENYIDGYLWWSRGENTDVADLRLNSFRNVIPGLVPNIYNNALFDSPPIINSQRLSFPTQQNIVGRFAIDSTTSAGYQFNADGTLLHWANVRGEDLEYTGTYTLMGGGEIRLDFQFIDFGDGPEPMIGNIGSFGDFFISADGGGLVTMNRYTGEFYFYSRR